MVCACMYVCVFSSLAEGMRSIQLMEIQEFRPNQWLIVAYLYEGCLTHIGTLE